MANRIRLPLLSLALERASRGENAYLLTQTAFTGVSADALFLIIKKAESLRDKYGRQSGKLRGQVRMAAIASGLPPDRRRAYEVLAMNYYGLIKEFRAQRKRELEASRAARRAHLAAEAA